VPLLRTYVRLGRTDFPIRLPERLADEEQANFWRLFGVFWRQIQIRGAEEQDNFLAPNSNSELQKISDFLALFWRQIQIRGAEE
jgi:hypothetical protein